MESEFIRRSLLYIPGSSIHMLEKAAAVHADGVILDLEDGVSIPEKELARRQVVQMLPRIKRSRVETLVRVNGMDTIWGVEDLKEILKCELDTIILPKANRQFVLTADCIMSVMERQYNLPQYSIKLIPMFETTEAIMTAYEILGLTPRIVGGQLGAEDLTKEMEISRTHESSEIRFAREQLIFAARARGVDSFDTPYTDVKNLEGLRIDAENARNMGFTGKTCIHPGHLDIINDVFTPSDEDVEIARGIVAAMKDANAHGYGACMYHNKMVDAPVAERAAKLVAKQERIAAAANFSN